MLRNAVLLMQQEMIRTNFVSSHHCLIFIKFIINIYHSLIDLCQRVREVGGKGQKPRQMLYVEPKLFVHWKNSTPNNPTPTTP